MSLLGGGPAPALQSPRRPKASSVRAFPALGAWQGVSAPWALVHHGRPAQVKLLGRCLSEVALWRARLCSTLFDREQTAAKAVVEAVPLGPSAALSAHVSQVALLLVVLGEVGLVPVQRVDLGLLPGPACPVAVSKPAVLGSRPLLTSQAFTGSSLVCAFGCLCPQVWVI